MAKYLVTIQDKETKETEVEAVIDKAGSLERVYGLVKSLPNNKTVTLIEEVNTKKSKKK